MFDYNVINFFFSHKGFLRYSCYPLTFLSCIVGVVCLQHCKGKIKGRAKQGSRLGQIKAVIAFL